MPPFARIVLTALLLVAAGGAGAGPVTEAPVRYEPSGNTAVAITGPITLSQSSLAFGTGTTVGLEPVEDGVEAAWDGLTGPVAGQIFAMERDPGTLLNGNTLCGPERARYVVVSEREAYGMTTLTLSVFGGEDAPTSDESAGFCGTFGYDADAARKP